jgi:hypothetical protein
MLTIADAQNRVQGSRHPLTISGVNIHELARTNPSEAHKMVARAVGDIGHKSFFAHRRSQECIRKAMAIPLPGASANAILKSNITVGSHEIRPVCPVHFAALQALDSPILKLMEDATTGGKSELKNPTPEQKWEACHVFTAEPKQLFRDLKAKGVDYLREQSQEQVGLEWDAAEIELAMPAIIEQLHRHIQTTVKFAAEMEAKGDVSFFREQGAKA